ncbi:MAG: PilZ domain-containing protein [Gammaproteobacteria bacterium]|nr:PilZ domain-containing protein [Gammaproteobacteria bacterium]
MTPSSERRQNKRLNGSSIQAEVKRKGLFRLGGYQKIKVADFNRFGTRIILNQRLRVGEELLFNINKKNINIKSIVGFVCHIEEVEDGYSYGIQFDFSANKHMRSADIEESLSQIEGTLEESGGTNMVKPHIGTQSPHSTSLPKPPDQL